MQRKRPNRAETDQHLLDLYHRLAPRRQQEYFRQLLDESRDRVLPISFDQVLGDARLRDELKRLSAGCDISYDELAQVVNPLRYSSYFARSQRCTAAKLTSVDHGRAAEIAEVIVFVKVYGEVKFQHELVPVEFDVHVLHGELEIERQGKLATVLRANVMSVAPGAAVTLRARPGTWFTYADHPLTTYIRQLAATSERPGASQQARGELP